MSGIARLAKELGISTGTVSRALNGKPDVNDATRQRVLEAARRIGYAPNQAARALAKGQTGLVGFMIDLDPETAASSDYFFMGVFDGVQNVLVGHGMDLMVLPRPTGQDHYAYLERFVRRGVVDAMILAAVQRIDPRIPLLQQAGIPFVTLGRSADCADYSWVDLDFEGTATIALERLIAQGHRRIGITVPKGEVNFGYVFHDICQMVLNRHGISLPAGLIVETSRTEVAGYAAMDTFLGLDDPPTAILLIYEVTAIGVYRRMLEAGLQPGRDMAVVGFRDEPTIRFLMPTLTCFSLSLPALGQVVGTALLSQMPRFRDTVPQKQVQHLFPLALREGESDLFPPRSHSIGGNRSQSTAIVTLPIK